jgi:hypothetical protein
MARVPPKALRHSCYSRGVHHRKLLRLFRRALLAAGPVSLGALALSGCGNSSKSSTGPTCPAYDGGRSCIDSWSVPAPKSCLHLGDGGPGAWPVRAMDCTHICGPQRASCFAGRVDGGYFVQCPPLCAMGRRPPGLGEALDSLRGLGEWFARAAALEDASVLAFRVLERELALHRAPRRLRRAAARAARDEERHARAMSALACRFGAVPCFARLEAPAPRALEAIAADNAVEGCVRETFGALVATWQAEHARDPRIRAVMRGIARDETRHAALAWRVARWSASGLDAAARRRVAKARRAAVDALEQQSDAPVDCEFMTLAGMPDRLQARALFDALLDGAWV